MPTYKAKNYVFIILFYWVLGIQPGFGDMYTALCKLRDLPTKEQELIATFDRFLRDKENTPAIQELKHFVDNMREENHRILNDAGHIENPIQSFHLLYRIVVGWGNKLQQYLSNPSQDEKSLPYFMNSVLNNSKNMSSWPTQQDLHGANLALIRIRNVYDLNIDDLVQGYLVATKTNGLKGTDLLTIGQTASKFDFLMDSMRWLNTSIKVLSEENSTKSVVIRAYRLLGNVFLRLKAPHLALDTIKSAITIEPRHTGIKRDIAVYNDVISDYVSHLRPLLSLEDFLKINNPNSFTTPKYIELCRGELKSVEELSKLYCTFLKTRIPFILAKVEYVNLSPAIMIFHDVITDAEINMLKKMSRGLMKRSTVTGDDEVYHAGDSRISNNAWIYDTNSVVCRLSKRIETLTGLSTLVRPYDTYAEPFQVVNYGLGGMYEPHFDCLSKNGQPKTDVAQYRNSGERTATWMFYMSDVLSGGATVFPAAKSRVQVQKGSAAFWFNTHRNGLPDSRTLHAGCPVIQGDKWVANKWMRSIGQTFRRPCALDRNI